ncbi:MAG TPA: hypothetical protein VFQ82_01020, partial [Stellaceae bacterium]|nr:hypothetical protein [Stellaceae bacterium]
MSSGAIAAGCPNDRCCCRPRNRFHFNSSLARALPARARSVNVTKDQMTRFDGTSFLTGASADFIARLYARFLD